MVYLSHYDNYNNIIDIHINMNINNFKDLDKGFNYFLIDNEYINICNYKGNKSLINLYKNTNLLIDSKMKDLLIKININNDNVLKYYVSNIMKPNFKKLYKVFISKYYNLQYNYHIINKDDLYINIKDYITFIFKTDIKVESFILYLTSSKLILFILNNLQISNIINKNIFKFIPDINITLNKNSIDNDIY